MYLPPTLEGVRNHAAILREVAAVRRASAARHREHQQETFARQEEALAEDGERSARRLEQVTAQDLPWIAEQAARLLTDGDDPAEDPAWQLYLEDLDRRAMLAEKEERA